MEVRVPIIWARRDIPWRLAKPFRLLIYQAVASRYTSVLVSLSPIETCTTQDFGRPLKSDHLHTIISNQSRRERLLGIRRRHLLLRPLSQQDSILPQTLERLRE